tara:strand:+ start:16756 stop:22620 length:5865 start_codon:yes stop_codon:yes gene_type:complete
MSSPEKTENLTLELSDIIQIISPLNNEVNEQIYIISYINDQLIKLINTDNLNELFLNIDEEGNIIEDYVAEINLLDRSDIKGYAKQNNLFIDTWINIHFATDIPMVITGQITNVDEDMIEITTYPDYETIYLDFAYQGLSPEFNIKEIEIRDKPKLLDTETDPENVKTPGTILPSDELQSDELQSDVDYELDAYELPIDMPVKETEEILLSADSIIKGEDLGQITQVITVDEEFQRYSIEAQTNDLLDDILSTIPTTERTTKVLNNIHIIIKRYKELRNQFSVFDDNLNANKLPPKGPNYKPLVNSLSNLDKKLYWIIPTVSLKKKIYLDSIEFEDEDYPTVINNLLAFELNNEKTLYDNFLSNNVINDKNKYQYLHHNLNEYYTPFFNTSINENENLFIKNVNDNFIGIINNYDDFSTDVVKVISASRGDDDERIFKQKYVLQQFNTGLMSGKLTNNDSISISSFVMLPENVVRFSTINLPETNIMDKSNYNEKFINYWQLFHNKLFIESFNTDESPEQFIKNVTQYMYDNDIAEEQKEKDKKEQDNKGIRDELDEELFKESKIKYSDERFTSYLDSIIPKTKILFDLVKKYIDKPLNMISIIQYLEPFLIYKHDISFKQFQKIMFYIKERLVEYKKLNQEKKILFSELKKSSKKKILPEIIQLFNESELQALNTYGFTNYLLYSSSEILKKIYIRDDGNLINSIISLSNIELQGLEDFDELIKNQINKYDVSNDCSNKIAKKYTSLDLLEKDNNKIIYYDKEYDNTNYKFIDDYLNDISSLPEEQKLLFISQKLQQVKDINPEESVIEARAIIDKTRIVLENSYAILLSPDSTNKTYYIRKNETWIKDELMQHDDDICNQQYECLSVNNDCKEAESSVNNKILKNILNEFDTKNAINSFELKNSINSTLLFNIQKLKTLNTFYSQRSFKYNDIQVELGKDVTLDDIITSPHVELRDLILGHSDFVQKQTYIQQFVERFTREPSDEESPHWFYCNETSTKLLPRFISSLANAYIQNENYTDKLQELCRDIGVMSDDGESWVDKHSGYVIKSIDFDTDEGYDESGFKKKSRAELAEDLANTIDNNKDKPVLTPEGLMISNIINTLEGYIGVTINTEKDFIISNTLIQFNTQLPDEITYNQMVETARIKGKKLQDYKFQKNNTILLFTIAYTFIVIQTLIPSPKPKKTFPGCIKSFTGYPMENNDDLTGLQYITCIVYNIKKGSPPPWDTMKKTTQSGILKSLKSIIDKFIIIDPAIQERFTTKLLHIQNEGDIIPEEHDIKKWTTFLPPLSKPDLKSSDPINDKFIETLYGNIAKKSPEQFSQINVIKGKIIHFSIYIQILISNIIKDASPLLLNSSKEPFINNVCCNNVKTINEFLNQTNPSIEKTNLIIKKLSDAINLIDSITKPSILFSDTNTRKLYPPMQTNYSENTIYKSFIAYCQFNTNNIIDEKLLSLCIDNKSEYDTNDSIENKITKMKEEGKFYSIETLHQLHAIIHKKINVNTTLEPIEYNFKLIQLINELKNLNDDAIPNELLTLIDTLIKQKEEYQENDSINMRNIKNYLLENIDTFKTTIKDFIVRSLPKSTKKHRDRIDTFLSSLGNVYNKTHKLLTGDDINMFNNCQHLLQLILNISITYPNIIINKVDYKNISIPTHWDISQLHKLDIKNLITNHYKYFNELYDDTIISNILTSIQPIIYNIVLFASNIPKSANVIINNKLLKPSFDNEITLLLLQYCTLSIFNQYIELSNSEKPMIIEQQKSNIDTLSTEEVEKKAYGDISQIDIILGEKQTKTQKTATILYTYMQLFIDSNSSTIFNYDDVMYRVSRSKDKEKDQFTSYLKNLTEDERRVEDILKSNQLDRWGKGLQKGLTQYVKDTYDEEREALEKTVIMEKQLNVNDYVTDMNRDIYMFDSQLQMSSDEMIEREEYDMSNMHNDDDYDDINDDEAYDVGNRDLY